LRDDFCPPSHAQVKLRDTAAVLVAEYDLVLLMDEALTREW
jgi:hypothetical protein